MAVVVATTRLPTSLFGSKALGVAPAGAPRRGLRPLPWMLLRGQLPASTMVIGRGGGRGKRRWEREDSETVEKVSEAMTEAIERWSGVVEGERRGARTRSTAQLLTATREVRMRGRRA